MNACPLDICASSGTVTSAIIAALSAQEPDEEADSVPGGAPGVVVVEASGANVAAISVGRESPSLVGGRVDVTKIEMVGAGVSSETVMHEPRRRLVRRDTIQIFFMQKFYWVKLAECGIVTCT
jgi:hypothetical protein